MGPMRHRLPLLRWLRLVLALLLIPGCLGSDFEDLPLGIEKWDHGWMFAVEPDEEFSVGLFGNNAYPESNWRIVDYNSEVLRLDGEAHEKPRPPAPDVEAAEPGQYDEGIRVSSSHFSFTGLDLGTSPLRFEFVVAGEPIDVAEYTVAVVADACDAGTVAAANRCGGDGFATHLQLLHELNYGEEVLLEPGASIELVLKANALYEDAPWRVVTYNDSVIAIGEGVALGPARSSGDFTSDLDDEASHSFLPSWQFTITGVAIGESELVLEIAVDDRRIDVFEMTVRVE